MDATRRFAALSSLLVGLCLPGLAGATVSITPSPSYTGSYTVSWTDASGSFTKAYLAASLNGGAWTYANGPHRTRGDSREGPVRDSGYRGRARAN